MTNQQWTDLLRVLDGQRLDPLPVGLIIDSPWLPNWAGMSILDYFTSESCWLEANLKAIRAFPDVWFLPGFWSEFGMCTEPSAFGARCIFPENEFPYAEKVLADYADVAKLKKPNCRHDGLAPFVVKRLQHCQPEIERAGHAIRFAVARGPLNIASFLLGHTEMLVGIKTNPDEVHQLVRLVTDYLIDWLGYQKEIFPSIDGILVLDDLMGFLGEKDFREFALPYFQEITAALPVRVKALHNDAQGMITARTMGEMGFNLFNFSFQHPLGDVREATGPGVILLGNIPPRDVLAQGAPDDVRRAVQESLATLDDRRWLILSAGGGTPPAAPTANLEAFVAAAQGR